MARAAIKETVAQYQATIAVCTHGVSWVQQPEYPPGISSGIACWARAAIKETEGEHKATRVKCTHGE